MSDAELHDALFKHALTEQGLAGPGADLAGIPLKRMLEVEEVYRDAERIHINPRAIAAIYVAFNYQGESGQCASPVVIANGQAVCVIKLPKKCPQCEGCGRVANTPECEPWSVWENLPTKNATAAIAGIVRPIECARCYGEGIVE